MQHERDLAEARLDFSEWRGLERLETRFIEIEEEHISATLASSNKKIAELTKSRDVSRAKCGGQRRGRQRFDHDRPADPDARL